MANHHGDGMPPELREQMQQAYKSMQERGDAMVPNIHVEKPMSALGALKDHPAGMYGPNDEGAIQFAIGHDQQNGKVTLDFGTPVTWMAMEPEQAVHLAQHLIQHARKATKKPLKVEFPY